MKTHEYTTIKGPDGEKIFEAYAEQATPGAYRIFWNYGPHKNQITIVAIIRELSAKSLDLKFSPVQGKSF